MKDLSKSPYIKATGISLLLHGALVVCLAMLGPPFPVDIPVERITIDVDIVPVAVIEKSDTEPTALPYTSPSASPPVLAEQPVSRLIPDIPPAKSVAQAATEVASSASATAATSSETVAVEQTFAVSSTGGGNFNAGAGGGNHYDGGGRTSPAYLYGSRPVYPQAARKAGWEGSVVLRALIDTAGTVASVAVKEGSGYDILDEAALLAVKKWRYTPAKEAGVPVTSLHDIRVRFRLDEAD